MILLDVLVSVLLSLEYQRIAHQICTSVPPGIFEHGLNYDVYSFTTW